MPLLETFALLFLLLVILSRGIVFLWPTSAKQFFGKFAKNAGGLRYLAILIFITSLAIFYAILAELSLVQIIATSFAFALLIESWFMWHSEFYQGMIGLLTKKDDGWVRFHAGLSVLIALILLYFLMTT